MKTKALILLAALPACGQVLLNGDFESPSLGEAPYLEYGSGQNIGGWLVDSGTVDHVGASFAPTIGQSVELNGSSPGSISQTILTDPGIHYRVSFSMVRNHGAAPESSSAEFSFGSSVFSWEGNQSVFTPITLSFVVEGSGSDTLRFRALNGVNGGWAIGSVGIQASTDPLSTPGHTDLTVVPEPETYATIAGVGLLGFAAWRRRKIAAA